MNADKLTIDLRQILPISGKADDDGIDGTPSVLLTPACHQSFPATRA